MTQATVKVTHIGEDYATIKLYITTSLGSQIIDDIQTSKYIGEALADAGLIENES